MRIDLLLEILPGFVKKTVYGVEKNPFVNVTNIIIGKYKNKNLLTNFVEKRKDTILLQMEY